MSGMMVGITLAVVALKWFSAQNKATADEAKKKWTSALNNIVKEGGGSADEIQASMATEMEARHKSTAQLNLSTGATVAGFAAAGVAIGSFGGPVGMMIGGVVGAGIGFAAAMGKAKIEVDAGAAAREKEVAAIRGTIEGLIELNNAQKTLQDTLADIDAAGLSDERQIELKLDAARESLGARADQKGADAGSQISRIAAKIGASVAEVKATEGKSAELTKLARSKGKGRGASRAFGAESAAAVVGAMMELKSANELAAQNVKLTSSIYAKAADGLRGASNFAELEKAMPAFQASIRKRTEALEQSAALELKAAADAVDAAAPDKEKLKAALANEAKVKAALANRLKLQREGDKKLVEAVEKRIAADELAAKAAEAFRQEMIKTNKFMRDLGNLAAAGAKVQKNLSNRQALADNKDMDFSVQRSSQLGDLTMVKDLKKFETELRHSVRSLPPSMQAEANKMVNTVVDTAQLMSKGKESIVGKMIGPRDKAPSARDILKSVGIDPDKVDKSVLGGMQTQVAKAFEDQVLSAKEFDDIFQPLIDVGKEKAKVLGTVQDRWNQAIAIQTQKLSLQEAAIVKRTAAELKLVDVQTKNQVMMARAKGADEIEIGKILDRQDTKKATVALRGTGVRAGDIGGAVKAREEAEKRRTQIAKDIQSGGLSLIARKKLMTEDKKMQIVIRRTTGEIQRLGDQSEKAGRLMDQIDAERAKREVLTGLVTDFVVGGQEERRAMQKSVMGIQFAMATGTLQNQSPEQRQATVGMLDTLRDIEIPGAGGMTGKEVKQKLVFDDAVRMGLDPKIAEQLAKATTKEEKLITALDALTKQMEAANKAEAEGKAMGGLVHMAGGGTIFKPRGTDTVPAMLTPGEFVIRKSAVDKIGAGNLAALNNGGGVVYRANGSRDVVDDYQKPKKRRGVPEEENLQTTGGAGRIIGGALRAGVSGLKKYWEYSNPWGERNTLKGSDLDRGETLPLSNSVRGDDAYRQSRSGVRMGPIMDSGMAGSRPFDISDDVYTSSLVTRNRKSATPKAVATAGKFKTAGDVQHQNWLERRRQSDMFFNPHRYNADGTRKTEPSGGKRKSWGSRMLGILKKQMERGAMREKPMSAVSPETMAAYEAAMKRMNLRERQNMAQAEALQKKQEEEMQRWFSLPADMKGVPTYQPPYEQTKYRSEMTPKELLKDRRAMFKISNPSGFLNLSNAAPGQPGSGSFKNVEMDGFKGTMEGVRAAIETSETGRALAAGHAKAKAITDDPYFMKLKAERDRQKQPAQTRGVPFTQRDPDPGERGVIATNKMRGIWAKQREKAQEDMNDKWKENHFNNPNSPYYHKSVRQVNVMRARRDRAREKGAARRRNLGKSEFTQTWPGKDPREARINRAKERARQRRVRMGKEQALPQWGNFADGGQVDSVPAMLTPGEFVMNRNAVQRHGVGYMRSLNRGNVPGFNSGGIVGAKYLQNGGSTTGGGFNFGSLAGMLDTMTKAFPTLNNVITKLQNVFSDLNMTHNFKGDMSLAFSVTNTDALKQSVADAITPHISDLITRELDNRFGGFNATGP